jgi:serine protease AprX
MHYTMQEYMSCLQQETGAHNVEQLDGNLQERKLTFQRPAAYEPVTTIGSLDYNSNILASYSSRGPIAKQTYIKPNIVAPGTKIKSCSHQGTNNYAEMSGTSMATPCAAGVAALLLSAKKNLVGDAAKIRQVLQNSAFALKGRGCSSQKDHPNNFYGYGLVDSLRAIQIAN